MKLLVLTILVYTVGVRAQLLFGPGGLGKIGSDLGGRVGSGVGLGFGTALDTVPKVFGMGRERDSPAPQPRPVGPRRDGYDRDRDYGGDRRGGPAGRRDPYRRGSGEDYRRGRVDSRERLRRERERANVDSGRGRAVDRSDYNGKRAD